VSIGTSRPVNSFRYFKRLFLKDGDTVEKKIEKEKPIFQLEVHEILQMIDLYFEAFGKGLRVIEMLRHPQRLMDRNPKTL